MKRRDFLHNFAHAAAFPTLFSSVAFDTFKPNSYLNNTREKGNIIVFVKLEGGNDGLNTIIPMDQLSNLNRVRPHVVLPDNRIIQLGRNDLGIHPSLSDFKSFFDEGRMKIIQNVGYPNPDFSHFRSMDIVQSAGDSNKIVNTGWIGRYLESIHPEYPHAYPNQSYPHPLAVELSWQSSLAFTGISSSTSFIARRPDQFQEIITDLDLSFPDTSRGQKMEFLRLMGRQSNVYSKEIKRIYEGVQNSFEYPNSELAEQLEIVSRLIKGGLNSRIYMVDHGSFDTHEKQVSDSDKTEGVHSRLLKQLNDAITPFIKNLDESGDSERVIIMTFSEFGRTIVSNGSRGTDHGSAAPILMFGNKLDPITVGSNPIIDSEMDWQDNLQMEIDFRSVYNSLIDQWMGKNINTIEQSLFKQFPSIPIIQGPFRDQDGDGVFDQDDLEINSTFGSIVDLNGVEIFSLPPDNYSIQTNGVSCQGKTNGRINISVQNTNHIYTVTVPETSESYLLNSDNSHQIQIDDLSVGTYTINVTVQGKENYLQTFEIGIVEPGEYSAKTSVNYKDKSISVKASGSEMYLIEVNDEISVEKNQRFKIKLNPGYNKVKISTPQDCQGVHIEEVFISEKIEYYPNPMVDVLNLVIPGSDKQTTINIYSRTGILIRSMKKSISFSRMVKINVSDLSTDIFMIKVSGKTVDQTFKIQKK